MYLYTNEILNMFSFGTAAQKLTAVQTYLCAWYGAMLWDLYTVQWDSQESLPQLEHHSQDGTRSTKTDLLAKSSQVDPGSQRAPVSHLARCQRRLFHKCTGHEGK